MSLYVSEREDVMTIDFMKGFGLRGRLAVISSI